MKYTIDYNTGITEEFVGTLADAKAKADANVNYTQQSINIIDENDTVVATRKWWGVQYDENNDHVHEEDPLRNSNPGHSTSWTAHS